MTASEHPDLRCTLIDLDQCGDPVADRHLANEILSDSEEDEVALRHSERYVRRLARASVKQLEETAVRRRLVPATSRHAFRLEVGTPGSMDSLRFREFRRPTPGPRDVELKIRAAALNFKDVLKTLGMLPEKALEHTFHGSRLGMEAAGVVTRVGEAVDEYSVGDPVIASLPGSFSSHVTVPVDSLFAVQQSTIPSPSDAATIPVVYMTAYYALHDLARCLPVRRCSSTPPQAEWAWRRFRWRAGWAPRSSRPRAVPRSATSFVVWASSTSGILGHWNSRMAFAPSLAVGALTSR